MPTATLVDDTIRVTTEFRDKDKIRQIPGAKWNRDTRTWDVPCSWAACKTLRAVFGDDLVITESLAKWAWREFNGRIEPALMARAAAMDPENDTTGDDRLYPFQRTGVEFLVCARQAVLADEMGTGKTVQTITALEMLDAYPALVVAPATIKRNWKREFEMWAPKRTVVVVEGNATKRRRAISTPADVYVMNFEQIRLHSRLAPYGSIRMKDAEKEPKELNSIDFTAVVVDEAHRIKDARAKQTRAIKAAAGNSTVRFALTGTPIANRPDEIWSLLNFITPDEWPSKTRFIDRYCATSWNGFGTEIIGIAPETKDEFFDLINPRFLRRSKNLVLPMLPKKVRETRYIEMKPTQRKAYDAMEEYAIAALEGGNMMATTPLAQLTRLTQLASATAEIDEDGTVHLTNPSCKVDALFDLLEDLGDESVVVFADHKQLIDLTARALADAGISFGRITGDENEQTRQNNIEAFQRGELRVMLATLKAGGVGINFTRSNTVVFLQRSWSMVENRQAEDRVHRIGQEADSVLVIDLVAEGTIEEYRLDALSRKDDALEEIVRDREALAAFLRKKGAR